MHSTMVVGYQLAKPGTRMQVTAVVADSGRMYRSNGRVGHPGRCDRDRFVIGEHPVHRSLRLLRARYAEQRDAGYTRTLIAPVLRTLPLYDETATAAEVIAAFRQDPPEGGPIDQVTRGFLIACGLPAPPPNQGRAARAYNAAPPSRRFGQTELRRLVHGEPVRHSGSAIEFAVTADEVRVAVGGVGAVLTPADIRALYGALDAHLRLGTHPRP
ncbi:hypothetical protein [Embleya sp. AB8]|uniref:hypothetical protein n=1 Tax=Embleya sp. AB8 TaxID=3156304 RepID=UPI003C75C95E